TVYHDTGKVQSEGEYDRGDRTGRWIFNTPDGTRSKEGEFKDGQKSGPWTLYFRQSGKKFAEGPMENGVRNGVWRRYFENGQVEFEGRFERDKEEGLF